MDGQGNINVNAPNDITFTAGKNMNINVGQNMTTNWIRQRQRKENLNNFLERYDRYLDILK